MSTGGLSLVTDLVAAARFDVTERLPAMAAHEVAAGVIF